MNYTITLADERDELGLNRCDVDVTLDCEIDPGDPGCWRTRNGDGWPATPPSVELVGMSVDRVWSEFGLPTPITDEVLARVRAWADRQIADRWRAIEDEVLASAPSDTDYADCYEEEC